MPVVAARCVVTQHDGRKELSRRDTWIEGQDFRDLALAATAQLRLPPERCAYALFSPDVGKAFVGVLLEVICDGLSALVGPMGGPAVPASLAADETCSLDELVARVGFGPDAEANGIYPIAVTYAGLLGSAAHAIAPDEKGFNASSRTRCASAERLRLERGRCEGFYAMAYDVPSASWQAHDLERLLGLIYALLPACEPRWRESGTITQASSDARGAQAAPMRYVLELQRGDFIAHLRLPAFPVAALVEWLASRRCEIHLCHPMMRLKEVHALSEAR